MGLRQHRERRLTPGLLGVAQRALACERVVGGVAAGQGALLGLDGDTFLPAYQEVLVVLQLAEQVREALNLSKQTTYTQA